MSRIPGLGNQPLANGTDAIASSEIYDTTFYFTTSLPSTPPYLRLHIYAFYTLNAIHATLLHQLSDNNYPLPLSAILPLLYSSSTITPLYLEYCRPLTRFTQQNDP